MSAGLTDTDVLPQRWQQHRMHIRCGLSPHQSWRIASYLQMGQQLIERGHASAINVQLRMLHTLLSTAADAMLPTPWREVCLLESQAPLSWLRTELGLHDPLALQAVECAHQRAQRRLQHGPNRKN